MSESTTQLLPKGWTLSSLPEIAKINPRLNGQSSDESLSVNFVPMRAVSPEGGGLTDPEVRPYGEVQKGYTSFLSGDVIMAKITPCMENGKTAVVPNLPHELCFGSTEFHVVRPEADIQPKWIANFLLQHETRRTAQRHMTGAVGQMRVPTSFLENLTIPIAPAKEQQRIVDALDELLSDLDAGVEALRRAQAKLALYRASVLKAAVQGDLSADWRRQNLNAEPASVLLQRILIERRQHWEQEQLRKFQASGKTPPANWKSKYKEPVAPDTANLPELPKGWCWVTFDQLAWASGYGTSVKCSESSGGTPVLRIPNISGGEIDLAKIKFAPADYIEPDEETVLPGDLLVVRTNGSRSLIGRGAVVFEKLKQDYSFASYLIRLRLVRDRSLWAWVSLIWQSATVRNWIEGKAATSAGQYNISLGVLLNLAIPIPPSSEQESITDLLDEQFTVEDYIRKELAKEFVTTSGLRQSILRHAFTGHLVPQDPTDEPASELLRRIAEERAASATKKASPRKPPTKRKKREK